MSLFALDTEPFGSLGSELYFLVFDRCSWLGDDFLALDDIAGLSERSRLDVEAACVKWGAQNRTLVLLPLLTEGIELLEDLFMVW